MVRRYCNQIDVIDFIGHPYLFQYPTSFHTRNTGISSTDIPLLDFFILSLSSRSRLAFIRCLTSNSDERCSGIGSGLTGGEGAVGTCCLEGFEDERVMVVGAVRGVMSRKSLRRGLAGGGVGAFLFGGSRLVGKGVDLVAVVGGRDGIRGGGWEGRREGASRSSSSVSDVESLAA